MHGEHVRLPIGSKRQQALHGRCRSPARYSSLVYKTWCLCLANHVGSIYCKRIQFVGAVLRRQRLVGGRRRAAASIGENTTALRLLRTATSGKRGGRQGLSTTRRHGWSLPRERGMWVSLWGWGRLERTWEAESGTASPRWRESVAWLCSLCATC